MRLFLLACWTAILATAGCAMPEKAPLGPAGEPMERLVVRTSSGAHPFWVEIADDDTERERGLMYREPLGDDRGMLFEFPVAEEQGFWMKNTPSSLDIIYLDPSGRIVSIAKQATPYSEAILPSYGAAIGVLELRAGRADAIGAKPGDRVDHPFFRP